MSGRGATLLALLLSLALVASQYVPWGREEEQARPAARAQGRIDGQATREIAAPPLADTGSADRSDPPTNAAAQAAAAPGPQEPGAPEKAGSRQAPVTASPKPEDVDVSDAALPRWTPPKAGSAAARERSAAGPVAPVAMPADCLRPVEKAVEFEGLLDEARDAASSVWKDSYCWFRRDARDLGCPAPAEGWRYRYSRLCS